LVAWLQSRWKRELQARATLMTLVFDYRFHSW
jgi:hypothetical protein